MSSYPTLWSTATQCLTSAAAYMFVRAGLQASPCWWGCSTIHSPALNTHSRLGPQQTQHPDTTREQQGSCTAPAAADSQPVLCRLCTTLPSWCLPRRYLLSRVKDNNEEVKGFGCHSFCYHSTSLGTDTKEKHTLTWCSMACRRLGCVTAVCVLGALPDTARCMPLVREHPQRCCDLSLHLAEAHWGWGGQRWHRRGHSSRRSQETGKKAPFCWASKAGDTKR